MKLIELNYQNIKPINDEINLCLGYFDGVHQGHQFLIQKARFNRRNKLAVLTFDTPISTYLNNQKSKEILTSIADRKGILEKLDVDYLFVIKIDANFIKLSAKRFIEDILLKFNICSLFVGSDYRFGYLAEGNIALLQKYLDVQIVDLIDYNGEKIATSQIINLLKNGQIKTANRLLGYSYKLTGKVIKGFGVGSQIGFPTANIGLSANYVIPKSGVYKTIVHLFNTSYQSLTNVGIHPTINKLSSPLIEVFIPELTRDIYDEYLEIEFIEFLRDEKQFKNIDELKDQIEDDLKILETKK